MKRDLPLRAVPGLLALLLTILGALGWGIGRGGAGAGSVRLVDLSPSCLAPANIAPGALTFHDSRLGPALARAAAQRPLSRIQLWTDAVSEMPPLPGVPVDVVLLPRNDSVSCLAIRVPARVAPGVAFTVEVEVGRTAGAPAAPVSCAVRIERDGERVGAPAYGLVLARGERRILRLRDRVDAPGVVRYRATISGGAAATPGHEGAEAAMRVGEGTFALRVGAGARPLPGFESRSILPGEAAGFLGDARVRETIDALLLEEPLPDAQGQELIAECVRGGAGLLIVGGRGAASTDLGDLLPLTDEPPGGRATVLLVDLSGSMEPRRDALLAGVERLRAVLAAEDRIAVVLFRQTVIGGHRWQRAADARWDFGTVRPQGGTRLLPAVEAAHALFGEAPGSSRRMLVLSDGEWGDRADTGVARAIERLEQEGITTAALFVGSDPPEEAVALFPAHARAGGDLPASLLRLEEEATDRRIPGPLQVRGGEPPAWLRDALPPDLACRDLWRYYPRGRGERIAQRAEGFPLLGASEPSGRVVQLAAPADDRNAHLSASLGSLLHAVARRIPDVSLRAWREAADLHVEIRGEAEVPVVAGGVQLDTRLVAPRLRRSRLRFAPPGPLTITAGDAMLLVPQRSTAEHEGLFPRRDIAAAIAQGSGGRLFEEGDQPPAAPGDPAVHATLLAAALLLSISAALRTRAS